MARNQEVIRQWNILRELDARRLGVHIDELAEMTGVSSRTIRRDLDALTQAGFPVVEGKRDNKTVWSLSARLFQRLEAVGLSLSELGALYLGRTMLEYLVGPPFRDDVKSALQKIGSVLPARLRDEFDRMHEVFVTKSGAHGGESDRGYQRRVSHVVNAILGHRQLDILYNSLSSGREKRYLLEPYRLVFAQGAVYVRGFVPDYDAMRTFAVARMREVTPLEKTFTPREDVERDPFEHSLGIYSGAPVKVVLEFTPRAAPYVAERTWHPSQRLTRHADGRLAVRLHVSDDFALRTWVLGFGREVRVVEPASLAAWVQEELEETLTRYERRAVPDDQAMLPFDVPAAGAGEAPGPPAPTRGAAVRQTTRRQGRARA